MKQQIIVFFAIVVTLQFCSTTANPVETSKAEDDPKQQHDSQPHSTSPKPKLNMQKVEAVKTLCDVLINSSKIQEAQQRKLDAQKESEHDKTECHAKRLEHAGDDHADHEKKQEEKQPDISHSESEGRQNHEQQNNQQEHHESDGANHEHHHHHHHHHYNNNEEGQTETQNHQSNKNLKL